MLQRLLHFGIISLADLTNHPETMEWAAEGGNLELVQWLYASGCPCDTTCNGAARGGHLKVMQWALAHGCPDTDTTE